MTRRVIKIEDEINYLSESEAIKQLPANCLFDKGKVGCGGTTLAIDSNEPYVILVPYISLIENKVAQHPNLIPVYGGVTVKNIKWSVGTTEGTPVIIGTYDSLPKILKAINPSKYKLLVDEYHLLFKQYCFRDKAVRGVLDNYSVFKEYCFMTGTPLEDDFVLTELNHLPIVEVEWSDVAVIEVQSIKCLRGVFNSTVELINNYLGGAYGDTNAYIFVNSVNFIKELVECTDLNIQNCNVVYGKYNKTNVGIKRGKLPIKKDGTIKPKKVNLITSTMFEGGDIYDENGKIYIISDGKLENTLVDIGTSFQQIIGRIRNSKHITDITHLYKSSRYKNVSYDEFKTSSEESIKKAKKVVSFFSTLDSDLTREIKEFNNHYVTITNGEIEFDENLVRFDMYNYKIINGTYRARVNNLSKEYAKNGFNHTNIVHSALVNVTHNDLEGFETVVETLSNMFGDSKIRILSTEQEAYVNAAYRKYPFLKEAIEKLGFDGIRSEKYVQTNIKRKLISTLDVNEYTKVFRMLKVKRVVDNGNFVSNDQLIELFDKAYKELNITKKPRASDIKDYFNTRDTVKRINGIATRGYLLLNPKIIIK